MCSACGDNSGGYSFNDQKSGYHSLCAGCYYLAENNKAVFDGIVRVTKAIKGRLVDEFEYSLKEKIKKLVEEKLMLLKYEWIQEAREDNEKHIRSEVQKILFVDGMGKKAAEEAEKEIGKGA